MGFCIRVFFLNVCLISKNKDLFSKLTNVVRTLLRRKSQNFLFMSLLQFLKHTFMEIYTRTHHSSESKYLGGVLPYFVLRVPWMETAAPTLTVALLSRRYIVKEDYLARKFSSLTALVRPARAIVAPSARSPVVSSARQSGPPGKAASRAVRPGSCSFHAICITAASTG